MDLLRIIDKETKLWLRDTSSVEDVKEDLEEIIEVTIPNGMYAVTGVCPMWDGEQWIQNVPAPVITPEPHEPIAEERLAGLEQAMLDMMGGMF